MASVEDEKISQFIQNNGGGIATHWLDEVRKAGFVVSEVLKSDPTEPLRVACHRQGCPHRSVVFVINNLIVDVAVTDRDHPKYDERLADQGYRQAKEAGLIQDSISSLRAILDLPENASSDEIVDAIYRAHAEAGHRPQRVRAWIDPVPPGKAGNSGETEQKPK